MSEGSETVAKVLARLQRAWHKEVGRCVVLFTLLDTGLHGAPLGSVLFLIPIPQGGKQ